MRLRSLLSLLAVTLVGSWLFTRCKPAVHSLADLPEEQLRFGSGGGFAGTSTEHILLANGQYFKKPQQSQQYGYIATINRATARAYHKRAQALQLRTADFDHPGNMYYYLQLGEDKANRVTWGDINHPVDERIQALYKELLGTVSKVQRELPGSAKQ